MVVDFEMKRAPRYRVATLTWRGPWSDTAIRSHFVELARWARQRRLRTGKWIFREPADRVWQVSIEVRGTARGEGDVRVQTLPAATVASVVYNPEEVSPSLVWHGLNDWTRARRKDGTIRRVVSYREVYDGDPWKNAKAWARTDVQLVVKR